MCIHDSFKAAAESRNLLYNDDEERWHISEAVK